MYKILILLEERNGDEVFKFYKENGAVFETADVKVLESKIISVAESVPMGKIVPMEEKETALTLVVDEDETTEYEFMSEADFDQMYDIILNEELGGE